MNPQCARCGKIVYPTEKVNCLDKYWHKGCFHCEVCKMTLNMNNYKGYDKKPYCNSLTDFPGQLSQKDNNPSKTRKGGNPSREGPLNMPLLRGEVIGDGSQAVSGMTFERFITVKNCLHQSKAYVTVHNLFGFLTDFQNMSEYDIKNKAATLVQTYSADMDEYFSSEMLQFTKFVSGKDK
ncbi:UNVERIFIED_CONTAM: hypothetical protein FKN15_031323 [Acipenser sinensis]